jgi:glycosyltransferase involved in cell wall biosynthesis
VLPTAVDTDRYQPLSEPASREEAVIGWCGTSSGLKYLAGIEPALAAVLARNPMARLRVICDRKPVLEQIDPARLEYIPWSPETEVAALQGMTVGLMPLDEHPWSLGKCSYKMLLYMACGVPSLVSPVGMNAEVLQRGRVGLGARTIQEWAGALEWLLQNREQAAEMGLHGRCVVLSDYSLQVLAPRLAAHLRSVAG